MISTSGDRTSDRRLQGRNSTTETSKLRQINNAKKKLIKKMFIIDTTKTDLGLVSKNILRRNVSKVLNNLIYILWKNLLDTIE